MVEPPLLALFGGQKVCDHPKGLPCAKCAQGHTWAKLCPRKGHAPARVPTAVTLAALTSQPQQPYNLQCHPSPCCRGSSCCPDENHRDTKLSTPCPPARLGTAAPGPLSDGLGYPVPVTWLQHCAVCQPEEDRAANRAQKAPSTSPSSPHAQAGFGKLWLSLAAPQLTARVLSRHRAGDAAQDQTQRVALPAGDEGTRPRTHQVCSSHWGTRGFQLLKVTTALIRIHPAPALSSTSFGISPVPFDFLEKGKICPGVTAGFGTETFPWQLLSKVGFGVQGGSLQGKQPHGGVPGVPGWLELLESHRRVTSQKQF